ncbi:MAG: hypothetical protein GEU81_14285 [Nitriliruptorales bacterium]|nr:hypothetical protein [Nitriliruptorales bacterium]
MSSPRCSYRARLSVVPLDPRAETMIRNVAEPTELNIVAADGSAPQAVADTDMLVFLCTDTSMIRGDEVAPLAAEAKSRGLLVAGAITGAVAGPRRGTDEERGGLACLRRAVDMLVLVRDDALIVDLVDTLRGGRRDVASTQGP